MPKLKTKSGAKKRFSITASGKVKFKNAFSRHMQMNKPTKMKRKTRGTTILFKSDGDRVSSCWMPNDQKPVRKASPTPAQRKAANAAKTAARAAARAAIAKKAAAAPVKATAPAAVKKTAAKKKSA